VATVIGLIGVVLFAFDVRSSRRVKADPDTPPEAPA
jgi:hypothetical protein